MLKSLYTKLYLLTDIFIDGVIYYNDNEGE